MSSSWSEVCVEEIAASASNALATGPFGSAIGAKFFTESGVPVIRGSNLSTDISVKLTDDDFVFVSVEKAREFSRATARRGDLVFTCWGTINQVGLIHDKSKYHEYIVSNKQMKLTVDLEKADPKYIYYVFSSPEKQREILSNGIGAAVPGFNLGQLKKHTLKLPPLPVQKGIVQILDALDSKIDLNSRINQTLETMAQAIFKSWFVDFDPVKAKVAAIQEGRDPLRAAMSIISGKADAELNVLAPEQMEQLAATAALFPEEMEDSEFGDIPRGWCVLKVESILARLPAKTRYTKGQVSASGQTLVFEQGGSVLLGYHDGMASFRASADDPLFIFGDHTCVTRISFQPFDISQNVIPLQGKSRPTAWVYYAVKEKQKFQEYRRHWMELVSKSVVVATTDICVEFSKLISGFHLEMEASERQVQRLREIRNILLPKLLSGELVVAAPFESAGAM